MASSDALPGAAAALAEAQGSDAWAGRLLGLALVLPWWLPLPWRDVIGKKRSSPTERFVFAATRANTSWAAE